MDTYNQLCETCQAKNTGGQNKSSPLRKKHVKKILLMGINKFKTKMRGLIMKTTMGNIY